MASNNNGFAEALEDINTLLRVNKKVSLDVLDEAAKYFASKLKPKIKASKLKDVFNEAGVSYSQFDGMGYDENDDTITQFITYVRCIQ
ncbi:hypothetical protein V5R22_00165 [Bacillus thuringiensis]|uniref:hypothetical protein n=1 Tax=Bacillus thuringiensis TaxID=1428 RepID=UPI003D4C431F